MGDGNLIRLALREQSGSNGPACKNWVQIITLIEILEEALHFLYSSRATLKKVFDAWQQGHADTLAQQCAKTWKYPVQDALQLGDDQVNGELPCQQVKSYWSTRTGNVQYVP